MTSFRTKNDVINSTMRTHHETRRPSMRRCHFRATPSSCATSCSARAEVATRAARTNRKQRHTAIACRQGCHPDARADSVRTEARRRLQVSVLTTRAEEGAFCRFQDKSGEYTLYHRSKTFLSPPNFKFASKAVIPFLLR